jgi:hypothetical protein
MFHSCVSLPKVMFEFAYVIMSSLQALQATVPAHRTSESPSCPGLWIPQPSQPICGGYGPKILGSWENDYLTI